MWLQMDSRKEPCVMEHIYIDLYYGSGYIKLYKTACVHIHTYTQMNAYKTGEV